MIPLSRSLRSPTGVDAQTPQSAVLHDVAEWLLDGPAQLRSGPHSGAVAGTVSTSGTASYVYPEIAGYFLQWLTWRAQRFGLSSALAERAAAVQRWFAVWLAAGDPPATRVHLDGSIGDWRNRAVFCFDVAMVLRGLGSAAAARLIVPDAAVTAGVTRQLERFIAADGQFDACAMNAEGDAFPARWSTRRGAFLAKAAAGVLTAATSIPDLSVPILRAADATFDASVAALETDPHRDAHPLLYAFEGVLALPQRPGFARAPPIVALQFDALLDSADADGLLPETLDPALRPGPERFDVLAQALRIGALLRKHRPRHPPDAQVLLRLRDALVREVEATGALRFASVADASQRNVWATMFADQALAFTEPGGESDEMRLSDPLLV